MNRKIVSLLILVLIGFSTQFMNQMTYTENSMQDSQFTETNLKDSSPKVLVKFAGLDYDDIFDDNIIIISINNTILNGREIMWKNNTWMGISIFFGQYSNNYRVYYNYVFINEEKTLDLVIFNEFRFSVHNTKVVINWQNLVKAEINSEGLYKAFIPAILSIGTPNFYCSFYTPLNEFVETITFQCDTSNFTGYVFEYVNAAGEHSYYTYLYRNLTQSLYKQYNINLFQPNGLGITPNTFIIKGNNRVLQNGIGYERESEDNVTIIISDYFNGIVFNSSLLIEENINIFLPLYEVNIRVNSTNVGYLEIWREDLTEYLVRIPTKDIDTLPFTLLGNYEYSFKYYVNDVLIETKIITINETRYLNFGYWSIQSTITPETEDTPINYISLIIVIGMYALIIVLASIPKRITHKRSGMVF